MEMARKRLKDVPDDDREAMLVSLDSDRKVLRERTRVLDDEIIDLQTSVVDLRDDARTWRELL